MQHIKYSYDLFNMGILSITAASLVFLFSAEIGRRDLPGVSKPVVLRLGPITVVCLIAAAAIALGTTLDVLSGGKDYKFVYYITVGLIALSTGLLISIGLYFFCVTFQAIVPSNLWRFIYLVPFIIIVVFINWGKLFYINNIGFLGFIVGYLLSIFLMRNYLYYGLDKYEEAWGSDECYEKIISFIQYIDKIKKEPQVTLDENNQQVIPDENGRLVLLNQVADVYITAPSPGLILPSEYDPKTYPFGNAQSGIRKNLFDTYINSAARGLKIFYLFDIGETNKIIEGYKKQGQYDYCKKEGLDLFNRVEGAGIKVKYCNFKDIDKSLFKTLKTKVLSKYGVVTLHFERPRKVRLGEVLRNKNETKFINAYKEIWNDQNNISKELDKNNIEEFWNQLLETSTM